MQYPIPPDEEARLRALHSYNVLDTPPEPAFDRITCMAARLFSVPASMVSLVDEERQWFKSRYGLELRETPRGHAFCAHAILGDDVLVVPNAIEDDRFRDNPLVTSGPAIRFYAGAPLRTHDGHRLGTLCVIDKVPRPPLDAEQRKLLADLAATAMDELEIRAATISAVGRWTGRTRNEEGLAAAAESIRFRDDVLSKVLDRLPVGVWVADVNGRMLLSNDAGRCIWSGNQGTEIEGEFRGWWAGTGEPIRPEEWALVRAIRCKETVLNEVVDIQCFDGTRKTIRNSAVPICDAAGEVVGGISLNEDITERNRAEQLLMRRERQLEILSRATQQVNAVLEVPAVLKALVGAGMELVDAAAGAAGLMKDGLLVFTDYEYRDGRTRAINMSLGAGVGVPGVVIQTRRPYVTNDAAHDPAVVPAFREALGFYNLVDVPILNRRGELLGCFAIHNSRGGRPFDELDAEMLQGLAASAAIALENARILEEHRRAEDRLRQTTDALEATIQAAPLAMVSLDRENRVMSWNPAAERMFGWKREEIIGCAYPLAPGELEQESNRYEEQVLAGETLAGLELVRQRKDGSLVEVSASGAPLHDSAGTARGVMVVLEDITAQRAAQRALLESEEHRRLTIDSAPIGIVTVSLDRKLRSANSAYCRLVGRTADELIGTDFVEMTIPEDRDVSVRHFEALLRGDAQNCEFEKRYVRGDGSIVAAIVRSNMVRNAEGEPLFLMSTFEDVTARRQAEEALRESEERYRRLVETTPDAIAVHSGDRVLYVNPAAVHMFRANSAEEIIGRPPLDFVHPSSHAVAIERMRMLLSGEGTELPLVELKYLRRDGSIRDVEVVSIGFRYQDKPACLALIRDVTERKQAEAARKASDAQFRAVFESSIDGMFILDEHRNCVQANRAACDILGVGEAELIGLPIDSFVDASQRESFLASLASAVQTGGGRGLVRLVRGGASRVETDYAIRPEFLPGRHLVVVRDMTEHLRLEAQFRQAQKMEAVGRLAGGVAHDFNNLLTIISGYSHLLMDELDERDPIRGSIDEIHRAGERAAGLTRQLLAFSRRQVLQPEVIDLNKVIVDIEKMLRRLIGEDVELVTLLEKQIGRTKVDVGQIEQVIMNLAVNARDAMPEGGKLIIETANACIDEQYAHIRLGMQPGSYVMLAMSDNGIGMDADVQSHIFEPFFTTKGAGKGTGLGLSTVYGIVKQSGGDIWVYSELGHGTTFKIYLPRVDQDVSEDAARRAEPAPRGSETILVVEDEPSVRNLISHILRGSGYKVVEAASGVEALLACERHTGTIELLVTDVIMPGMSGRELAKRLETLRPDMRALYISGYTDNAIVHHGVLESHFEFIQKPFAPEELLRKVRSVIERRR